jgi:prevent-host-death family protein
METIGLFETKTRLSQICDTVARSRQPVTVTRRGQPLVRIVPIDSASPTIGERRRAYMARHGRDESEDGADFEPAPRSRQVVRYTLRE